MDRKHDDELCIKALGRTLRVRGSKPIDARLLRRDIAHILCRS
jgi:hypothetical protein